MSKIEEELYTSYFKYARSVIEERALPNVFDGFKSVHRRIVYSMWSERIYPSDKHRKCSKIVGDVMGKFHPHGDSSIYNALVRMAQPFTYEVPLIDGQGNFGSLDGDNAAAMRYTEAKLKQYSMEFFKDFCKLTTPMQDNYDATTKEPVYLPARAPNLLVNGTQGIAVGISTSIPSHNLNEVLQALIYLIDNPEATLEDIMTFIPGPDLPTAGVVSGKSQIYESYRTGEGNMVNRARYKFEGDNIVFYEVPYLTNKEDIMQQLAQGVKSERIAGVSAIRDESDREGPRIVLKVKNGYKKEIIINQVYSSTLLKNGLRMCFFALNEKGYPKIYNLMDFLKTFLQFRENIILLRTNFELENIKTKIHTLIGLSVAIENIKEIMGLISDAESLNDAKLVLSQKGWKCENVKEFLSSFNISINKNSYDFSPEQIKSILDLKLHNLVRLEKQKIENDLTDLRNRVEELNIILNDRNTRLSIIKTEFEDIKVRYGVPRKTVIEDSFSKFSEKDLTVLEEIIIILDKNNYIKRVNLSSYKLQNKGGKGRIGSVEDVNTSVTATTHSLILMFSDFGLVYAMQGYEIPEGEHGTKGRAIINLINIDKNEKIIKFLVISEDQLKNYNDYFLLFVSKNGQVRRNSLEQFLSIRSNGKKYMKDEKDGVSNVLIAEEKDHLFLATQRGMAVVTPISDFRVFNSRDSEGVRGCKLKTDDILVSSVIIKSLDDLVLTVADNGFGKISAVSDYRIVRRGGSGVINMKLKKNLKIIDVLNVTKEDEVILITKQSHFLRFSVENMSVNSRNTKGVKVCNLSPNDIVLSCQKFLKIED